MKMSKFALAATLLLSGGCDTMDGSMLSPVSTNGQVSSHYRPTAYPIAGRDRDMWVVVTGGVPGGDAAMLQQQTFTAMQRYAGMATRFTATPKTHLPEYKTVIVFNGARQFQEGELCRNPTRQSAAPAAGSELRLQAVFCRYDEFLSAVSGRASGGNNLSNPNFEALIRQTMTDLYHPPREEQRNEPEG